MPWAPLYVDADELEDFVRAAADNPYVATYGEAACRAIDGYCERQFGILAVPAVRTYESHRAVPMRSGRYLLQIDDVQDLAAMTVSVDGTLVASGADGYQLWPRNASADGRPYTAITLASPPCGDVDVLARFGWSETPAAVSGSVWLQVNRWHVRRESPYGIAGSPAEGSEVRLTAVLDPDVRAMLSGGRLIRKRMPQ